MVPLFRIIGYISTAHESGYLNYSIKNAKDPEHILKLNILNIKEWHFNIIRPIKISDVQSCISSEVRKNNRAETNRKEYS